MAVDSRGPEEEVNFGQDAGLFVPRNMVPRYQGVQIGGREDGRGVRRGDAELAALGARDGARGRDTQEDGTDEVREEDAGEGVGEVRRGVLRGTKGAVRQDVGAVLVVEQLGRFALELVVEDGVARIQGADGGEARQDEVVGRGRVRARDGEDVLGAEDRKGGHGQREGREPEEHDGEQGARG